MSIILVNNVPVLAVGDTVGPVTTEQLAGNLGVNTIALPFTAARALSAGQYLPGPEAGGGTGLLAAETAPAMSIVSGGTRCTWVAGDVTAINWQTVAPVDFDETEDLTIHFLASMSDVNDTPTLGVAFYEGTDNDNHGGTSAAITGTAVTAYTVVIAGDELAGSNQWNIRLTPAAHAADDLRIDAIWMTYHRS